MSVDDLKVTKYDEDLVVVLEAALALNGADGQGLAAGGLLGQVLAKNSDLDWDTKWENPTLGIPTNGTAGQLLSKVSSTPYDTLWIDAEVGIPSDGTAGQVLSKASSDPYDTIWIDPAASIDDSNYAKLAVNNIFLGQQIITQGVLTTSKPAIDISQTWNTAAVSDYKAIKVNVTWLDGNGNILDLQESGVSVFSVNGYGTVKGADTFAFGPSTLQLGYSSGMLFGWSVASLRWAMFCNAATNSAAWQIASDLGIGWNSGTDLQSGTRDLTLFRDAANTLAQRRLANAQTFRLYATTDATNTNFERAEFTWISSVFTIRTAAGGTGVVRPINFPVEPTFGGVALNTLFAKLTAASNTFTGGPIVLNRVGAASSADMFFNVDALQTSYVNFQQVSGLRWRFGKGSSAESGSGAASVGSDFNLQAYDNAGASLGNVFHVIRGLKTLVHDAPINFATVTAPAAPNNGDFWFDGTNLKIRIGGVSRTITVT